MLTDQIHYQTNGPTVEAEPLRAFAAELLQAAGVGSGAAEFTAETLVHADLRGVHSHGVRLVAGYIATIRHGQLNPTPSVRETVSGPGHAVFDGDRGLGQIGARAGMTRAIELAKRQVIGTAVVRNTGHFGAAAYWALLAVEHGCIGYCTSNMAGTITLAYGSSEGATGNIPLAWGFPTKHERPVVLDMACGVAAIGKVAVAGLGGQTLPEGVAADSEGRPTRDPSQAVFVYPAAGPKGYALAMVHDLLAGGLSGGGVTIQKPTYRPDAPPEGAMFFLAIDVGAIMPLDAFQEAMDAQVQAVNALPPAEGVERIYMPGQIEWERLAERETAGIPFPPGVLQDLEPLAAELGIATPWTAG